MKILQIGLGNNPGGIEAFVMNYYRELADKGIQFDFVCMYDKIAHEEEIRSLGGEIFYVPDVKKNYFGYVRKMKKILNPEAYGAVHVNMLSAANITPLKLCARAGMKKIIVHSHNSSVPGLVRSLMDRMNRPGLNRYATARFACGEKAARWMFGDFAFEHGEVKIIRNAVDVDKYIFSEEKRNQVRREHGFGERLVIGHVGRFDLQKNHEGLLDIFQEISRREPDAVLCLVGDGGLKEHIQKKAADAGLKEKVFFMGVRENVEDFLSSMDVFLFPSLFEGLPFTLVEAQTNGLPCVVSDTITTEAFLGGNQVRTLSLKESKDRWAGAVLECTGQGRKSEQELRRELMKRHFDIKKEAERLRHLYQE